VCSVPRDEDGVVMVKAEVMIDGVGQLIMAIIQRTLPPTETRQRLVRVVIDFQTGLLYTQITASKAAATSTIPCQFLAKSRRGLAPVRTLLANSARRN